jgi:hypothetical protein
LDDNTPSRKESPSKKLVSKTSEKDQSENLISSNTDGISSKIDQLGLSEMAKDTLVESRGNEVEANDEPKSRVASVHKNDTEAEITTATEDSNKVAPSEFKVKIRLNPAAKSGRGRGRGRGRGQGSPATRKPARKLGTVKV